MDIPTKEPQTLVAGDTWKWSRADLILYPADVWTLTYRFKNAGSGFEVVASPDGLTFSIVVADTVTAAFVAGNYRWFAQVTNGSEAYTVGTGTLCVRPDFFSGSGAAALDTRSFARKTLDVLEAFLSGDKTPSVKRYEIAGRMLEHYELPELYQIRALLRAEIQAQNASLGLPDPRRAYLRFGRV